VPGTYERGITVLTDIENTGFRFSRDDSKCRAPQPRKLYYLVLIGQIEVFPGSHILGKEETIDKTQELSLGAAYRPSP